MRWSEHGIVLRLRSDRFIWSVSYTGRGGPGESPGAADLPHGTPVWWHRSSPGYSDSSGEKLNAKEWRTNAHHFFYAPPIPTEALQFSVGLTEQLSCRRVSSGYPLTGTTQATAQPSYLEDQAVGSRGGPRSLVSLEQKSSESL
jgi:hypothetical protein